MTLIRRGLGPKAVLLAAMLLMSACTVITVDGGKTTIAAGQLQVAPASDDGLTAITRQSYGLDAGPNKLVIGYSQEQTVSISDNSTCAIVVFQSALTEEDRKFFRELAGANRNICLR